MQQPVSWPVQLASASDVKNPMHLRRSPRNRSRNNADCALEKEFSNVFLELSAARQDFANRMVEVFQRFALDSAFDDF